MPPTSDNLVIRAFDWSQWRAIWQLRLRHLAEEGIVLDEATAIPAEPEDLGDDDQEWDFNHIDSVYLRGVGWFWLAWVDGEPVGHIGAQDLGQGGVELRAMYVARELRRRGIGAALVSELLRHCAAGGAHVVELWTAIDGVGRKLYEPFGFRQVPAPGAEYPGLAERTHFTPGDDQIRMRLALKDDSE